MTEIIECLRLLVYSNPKNRYNWRHRIGVYWRIAITRSLGSGVSMVTIASKKAIFWNMAVLRFLELKLYPSNLNQLDE